MGACLRWCQGYQPGPKVPRININFPFFPYYSTLGQVFTTKLLSIKDQHRTAEGSPSDDDSYLGYSGSDFVFKISLNSLKFSLTRETGT